MKILSMSLALVGFIAVAGQGVEAVPFETMHRGMTAPTVCTHHPEACHLDFTHPKAGKALAGCDYGSGC